jgi:hypothetical protein
VLNRTGPRTCGAHRSPIRRHHRCPAPAP